MSDKVNTTKLTSFEIPEATTAVGDKIVLWPAVQSLLSTELKQLPRWEDPNSRPEDWVERVNEAFDHHLLISQRVQINYTAVTRPLCIVNGTMTLTDRSIRSLCTAYFSSLYYTYPILDRHMFYSRLLPRVCEHSFAENDEASALVLLVLGLGTVAQEGSCGPRIIDPETGIPTGVRGGTVENPPGLVFLQEAQRRIGVLTARQNLVLLQCYLHCALVLNQGSLAGS
jgi:hypothetical protein